ncbi:MAG: SDR family NAD(P)-dependent oxidoreductase [Alicyclobacillaceae bacterium]|nr:SDR family NAD(P)-dependent oxidoreductase [Alicyclobacillaceae bacterium]
MQDLEGKVAFITGGGSGVGLGQAKVFAREGMKVAIADIRKDHLDEAMAYFKEVKADVHPIQMDITDRKQMAEAADEVEKVFGKPVQLLCNTAGVSIFGPMQNATYEDWEWILNVNLWGVINGLQTFVPRMLKYGQGGHIVNTSSMSGFQPLPGTGIYVASKFAVRGLTEVLRMDLEPYGIGVSVLCPCAVNTNIHEAVLTRPKHLANTGYYGADEEMFKNLKRVIEVGLDPVTLAEHVLKAVKNNELYVIPYPEARDILIELHNNVLKAIPPKESDPDWVKRVEAMSQSAVRKMK